MISWISQINTEKIKPNTKNKSLNSNKRVLYHYFVNNQSKSKNIVNITMLLSLVIGYPNKLVDQIKVIYILKN